MTKLTILLVVSTMVLLAQQKNDGDEVVQVPKKYVSSEGLQHQQNDPVNKWIGMGKEIGIATREGLNAVVDTSERFGATRVGNFVMFLVAWKIMAKEILGIFLGIPLFVAGICMWVWAAKRLFFGYRVLVKVEGKIKTFEHHKPYEFYNSEGKAGGAIMLYGTLAAWTIVMMIVIFA